MTHDHEIDLSKPDDVLDLRFDMSNTTVTINVHDTETIDGVLFVRWSRYDAEHRLCWRQLTRADLVKG